MGHETDFTLSDAVADERASTPTAGAILVVRGREELHRKIGAIQLRMARYVKSLIIHARQDVDSLSTRLSQEVWGILDDERRELQAFGADFSRAIVRRLQAVRSSVESELQRLTALDPSRVLARGYTVTMKDGKTVRSVAQISGGQTITTSYEDGSSESKVTEVRHGKDRTPL